MTTLPVSPLWPADLDHLRIDSPDPEALADFYRRALGMDVYPIDEQSSLVYTRGRRLILGRGVARGHPWSAYALANADQVERHRRYVRERGATLLPSPSPLFDERAFAVRDPDSRLAVFGVMPPDFEVRLKLLGSRLPETGAPAPPAGRLQHVVVASERFPAMMAFYCDTLGFLVSDTVHVDDGNGGLGEPNVCFLRGNLEHHSFGVFRAPRSMSDHFALDVPTWDAIRDWADHFAALDVPIWWGPGRHGAGNNLFFMVKDPDGNNIEISAELERIPKGEPGKRWPAGGRALNLWGPV